MKAPDELRVREAHVELGLALLTALQPKAPSEEPPSDSEQAASGDAAAASLAAPEASKQEPQSEWEKQKAPPVVPPVTACYIKYWYGQTDRWIQVLARNAANDLVTKRYGNTKTA